MSFYQNEVLKETFNVHKLLIAESSYLHFFGGVPHHSTIYAPWHGFLYFFHVINSSAIKDTDVYEVGTCAGCDGTCFGPGGSQRCLSNCEWN